MKNEIYKITNKINNKIYIGLTIQGTRTRYLHHLYEARSGSPFPIHRAIRKYGEENFEIETIISIEGNEELKNLEKFYIQEYKANNRQFGYNMTEGGDGTFGRLHSEETKDLIRQKAIGRKPSEDTRRRQSEAHDRNKNEDWYKENKRKAALISALLRKKKIEVYDLENNYINTYDSISETAKELNISRGVITDFFKNPNIKSRFYKFKQVEIIK